MRRRLLGAALLLILASQVAPALAADYVPRELALFVYVDGVVDVDYRLSVDPALPRVSFPLLCLHPSDLTFLNEDGLPLEYSLSGEAATVDTLGAASVTATYSTVDLTGKVGALWSLNVTSPTNLSVTLPAGSTIVGTVNIPLQIGSLEGRPLIVLPSGKNSVSYLLGAVGSKDKVYAVITDAEQAVAKAKAGGVVVTPAEALLTQAKAAFAAGDYLKAEQLAAQVKTTLQSIQTDLSTANAAYSAAAAAVAKAKSEGRSEGVPAAEALLGEAQALLKAGSYKEAAAKAKLAEDAAAAAKAPFNFLLYGGAAVALIVALAGVYLYTRRQRETAPAQPAPPPAPPAQSEAAVNVELIFQKNPDLRVDDKEVIRFLAQRGGEAFANEIRDRFEIPRTSAWRMIQRLISLGIVEERKIGGQSVIAVAQKYRREA